MAISVIPAYRVVTHLARRTRPLTYEDAMNSLESGVRDYVRAQLAKLHPSLIELATRSVVGQLGDPEVDDLLKGLSDLDDLQPRSTVEDALDTASKALPRPDLSARMFVFPGDGESSVLTNQMGGVLGFSLGASATLLFVWPGESWRDNLEYTVIHEYSHLVRNLLFPRGVAAGRLVYMKTQQPETLLDAMVAEGIADCFAEDAAGDIAPVWRDSVTPPELRRLWPRVHRRFDISDANEIRRFLFGDGDRVPSWIGYALGHRIVRRYLDLNPTTTPAALVSMSARAVYDGSRIEDEGI